MPVRFPCERCRTTLSIARRKIGTRIDCPKCGQPMTVPSEAEASARSLLSEAASRSAVPPPERSPLSEFAVFDDEEDQDPSQVWMTLPGRPPAPTVADATPLLPPLEMVETRLPPPAPANALKPIVAPAAELMAPPKEPPAARSNPVPPIPNSSPAVAPPPPGPAATSAAAPTSQLEARAAAMVARQTTPREVPGGWLLVARRTVFLQGILIFCATLFAFVAGWMIGRNAPHEPGKDSQSVTAADTVLIQGTLTYIAPSGNVEPDDGAVVLAWPQTGLAEPRIDPQALHPVTATPGVGSQVMLALEDAGAAYVRAAPDGAFNLVVPRPGKYYVLFISRRSARPAGQPLVTADQDALKRFFAPTTTLIGRQKYHLSIENFDQGLELLAHDFGRSGVN